MYNAIKNLLVVLLVAIPLSNTFGAKLQKELSRGSHYKEAYGEEASIEEHPYMVYIKVDDGGSQCSGSLISSTCVLTVAHCVDYYEEVINVRAGSKMCKEGGSTQSVANSSISKIPDMDIAVLKLNGAFKGENIKPIDVNSEDFDFSEVAAINVAGWSSTEKGPLRKMQVRQINVKACQGQGLSNSLENSFCAVNLPWGIPQFCGDYPGGPAIINGKQVGIVSTKCVHYCQAGRRLTAFTKLGSKEVSTFLKEAMQKLEC